MLEELFEKFDGAFAENTIRAYRADFNHFNQWCVENDIVSMDSSNENWKDYVEHCAQLLSTATVGRRIASLATIFKLSGLKSFADHPDVILAMKRMYRAKGRIQEQAEPLTKQVLTQLLQVCSDDIWGLRNKVLLNLGYETMRRRSELCNFKFENIQVMPNGRKAILMERSKTDQYGNGKLIPISDELFDFIKEWQETTQLTGYILRGITQQQRFSRKLAPASINRILKDLQNQAGLKLNTELSGHSFRVGKALDLLMEGEPLEKIMLRGGWRSESTAMRYLRSWQEL